MYELLIALLFSLLFFGYCSIWSDPDLEADVKNTKLVIDLLLQRGYSPQKVMEIVHVYN